MSWIRRIETKSPEHIAGHVIDLGSDSEIGFRHLILTGPNGSGKTTVLRTLCATLRGAEAFDVMFSGGETLTQFLAARDSSLPAVVVLFEAFRQPDLKAVSGPGTLSLANSSQNFAPVFSRQLLQFLVNRRSEAAFAMSDGDHADAEFISAQVKRIEESLSRAMGRPDLRWKFDRKSFSYRLSSNGQAFGLSELADGHASALMIVSEIMLRVEACREAVGDRSYDPDGIVLIDELETHLHLELQEQMLPLLTELFPRLQFLVATHSPAVVSSIDGAVVYDLKMRESMKSEELRGMHYGTLMKSVFQISSDFDLRTEKDLQILAKLYEKFATLGAEGREGLRRLAERLARDSHPLALEALAALENPDEFSALGESAS